MDAATVEFREKLAQHLIKAFAKRRMEASYAQTADQARTEILAMLPRPCTVMRCGSVSVRQIGILEDLAGLDGVSLIDPFEPGLAPQEAMARRMRGMSADVMLTSTNAVTEDGVLVNLDGTGNRVAGMAFGPAKVILVVGMNKVAKDIPSAMARVRQLAAPINALRIKSHRENFNPPCVTDGRCHDCRTPEKTCNVWSIIEGQRHPNRLHVKLVGEDLGY